MINKVTESWEGIEEDVSRVARSEAEERELQNVLGKIAGVRDVLKKMCQVSVTRTSLKNAVREALLPVVEEHRDELFPEIVELRRRLQAADEDPSVLDMYRGKGPGVPEEVTRRLEELEGRLERLSGLETRFESDVSALSSRLESGASEVDRKLAEGLASSESRQQEKVDELRESLDGELRKGIVSVEDKVRTVEEYLGRLEASIPETAQAAAGEVETRLRKEIESMVEQLTGKLGEVEAILRRMEEFVPRREALEQLDQRLAALEGAFERVSGQVGNIDSVTPEIRGLGERFADLRRQVAGVTDTLDRTSGEVREALTGRLVELQTVLHDGIARWESDQSQVQERLSALRDSLRDQLAALNDQVRKAEAGFWGKVTRKKEGSLKLSAEDYEDLATKMEGIISGLEAVIARKRQS